jgi:hypothetical protein
MVLQSCKTQQANLREIGALNLVEDGKQPLGIVRTERKPGCLKKPGLQELCPAKFRKKYLLYISNRL